GRHSLLGLHEARAKCYRLCFIPASTMIPGNAHELDSVGEETKNGEGAGGGGAGPPMGGATTGLDGGVCMGPRERAPTRYAPAIPLVSRVRPTSCNLAGRRA